MVRRKNSAWKRFNKSFFLYWMVSLIIIWQKLYCCRRKSLMTSLCTTILHTWAHSYFGDKLSGSVLLSIDGNRKIKWIHFYVKQFTCTMGEHWHWFRSKRKIYKCITIIKLYISMLIFYQDVMYFKTRQEACILTRFECYSLRSRFCLLFEIQTRPSRNSVKRWFCAVQRGDEEILKQILFNWLWMLGEK